jgi:4-aminobutyrate aminotransferase-like enzyme
MVAKRGRGCRVEDVDGNEFLDFAAGHRGDLDGALPS